MTFTVIQVDPAPLLEPFDVERATIEAAGGRLEVADCTSEEQILASAAGAEVLWLNWTPGLSRRVLESLPACRLAIRWGVGYDQIDVEAATELGIAVANAPAWATDDVAEHTIGLLLACARRIAEISAAMRAGEWPPARLGTIARLRGRTIGLIGVGRIGSAVATRARGLGMDVLGYDAVKGGPELEAMGVGAVSLDELLERSDVVSLHMPLTEGSRGLVDRGFLARMRAGSILINTSRGPVVDGAALIESLESGHLAAAGLDVYEEEPLPADHPLRAAPHVVMTPHVAAFSDESWADLRAEMCRTTIDFMTTGWAQTIVNPEVRTRLRG